MKPSKFKSTFKTLALATSALLSLASTFTATVATAAAPAQDAAPLPARWDTAQRGLILIPDESHGVTMNLAVQRLRAKSPIRLDLVDGIRDNRTDFNNYDLVIILGVTGAAPTDADNTTLAQAWIPAAADNSMECGDLSPLSTAGLVTPPSVASRATQNASIKNSAPTSANPPRSPTPSLTPTLCPLTEPPTHQTF